VNCPLLPSTGSSNASIILLAVAFVALGGAIVLLSRRRRGLVAATVIALGLLAAGVGLSGRSAYAADCTTTTTTDLGNLPPVGPTTTLAGTTTTVAIVPAQISGTYTRNGFQLVETDPPAVYPNNPGTDWQLPVFVADNGPVAGALVTLRVAGDDGLLDTGDDVVTTTNTAGDGSFSFSTTDFGAFRVTITALPTDRQVFASYGWPGNSNDFTVTAWSLSPALTGTVAAGDSVTGEDFLATNTKNLAANAD